MSRSTKEWIGKTDDSRPPPRIRLRIFQTHNGICHLSKRKIMPGESWQADHVIALINGGENRESNMAPALAAPHKIKTKADVAEKSMVYHKAAKHVGISFRKRQKIQSRGFPKSPPQHTASRPIERGT